MRNRRGLCMGFVDICLSGGETYLVVETPPPKGILYAAIK